MTSRAPECTFSLVEPVRALTSLNQWLPRIGHTATA